MLRKILTIVPCLVLPFIGLCAPFSMEIEVVNSYGNTNKIIQSGNDYVCNYHTKDGFSLIKEVGKFFYATNAIDGSLVSSGIELGTRNSITNRIQKNLFDTSNKYFTNVMNRVHYRNKYKIHNDYSNRHLFSANANSKYVGSVTGCVFLIAFPITNGYGNVIGNTSQLNLNCRYTFTNINEKLNGDTPGEYNNSKFSVKQYFETNSFGKFHLNSYLLNFIMVDHPFTYYDVSTRRCEDTVPLLLPEVIHKVQSLPNYESEILPKFRQLSRDGNYVRATTFLFAGDTPQNWSMGLWPHSWTLHFDKLGFYDESGEFIRFYHYYLAQIPDTGVGTLCHETAHMVLDFPDLYSYTSSGNGVGRNCLMGHGSSSSPLVQICPFLKLKCGWIDAISLNDSDEPRFLRLPHDNKTVYKYTNPDNPKEYYLIEHRTPTGIDKSISLDGVAIWRCNEDYDNKYSTYVGIGNDKYVRNNRVSIVDATGTFSIERGINYGRDDSAFGYTYTGYKYVEFSDESVPTAMFFGNKKSNIKLSRFQFIQKDTAGSARSDFMTCLFEKTNYRKLPEFSYTGKEIKPLVSVVLDGKELTFGIDYLCEYSDNIEIGVAKATIIGIDKFKGRQVLEFRIVKSSKNTNNILKMNLSKSERTK